MKKSLFAFIAIVLTLSCFLAPLQSEAKKRTASKPATATKEQNRSPVKDFYRSLSKRRSNNRADYTHLSDLEFANFRPVTTTGMGKGKLYRSSSPVNPWGSRNLIADNAARNAGIKTFLNLSDTERKLRNYAGFKDSYYSSQKIVLFGLNWKYQSEEFTQKLARGVRLMAHSQPPFLVHCDMGKDRAGFVCAILECLMGASAEEVTADYIVSFYNYFGIKPNTDEYLLVVNNEIRPFLARAFGVKDILNINLSDAAERYLLNISVSANDISALRRKLGSIP